MNNKRQKLNDNYNDFNFLINTCSSNSYNNLKELNSSEQSEDDDMMYLSVYFTFSYENVLASKYINNHPIDTYFLSESYKENCFSSICLLLYDYILNITEKYYLHFKLIRTDINSVQYLITISYLDDNMVEDFEQTLHILTNSLEEMFKNIWNKLQINYIKFSSYCQQYKHKKSLFLVLTRQIFVS